GPGVIEHRGQPRSGIGRPGEFVGEIRCGSTPPALSATKLGVEVVAGGADRYISGHCHVKLECVVVQLVLELQRCISFGTLTFQAAASSAVSSPQTAKRSAITCRSSAADNRCRRTRKCGEMPLNADRNRGACLADLKRFIARSRCRMGRWEFSARLFRHFDRRWATDGITTRWAAP